mmetsp:Transcript_10474/g.9254  ORF Transcript_10474/g.9254 Transcript_10474/m.9254 type:complete len:104 (+) Transcript_10474:249-560(+)
MTTPLNRVTTYREVYTIDSYNKVDFSNIFCLLENSKSDFLTLEIEYLNSTAVSWLSLNKINGNIEGIAPEQGATHALKIKVKPYLYYQSYSLNLNILTCANKN